MFGVTFISVFRSLMLLGTQMNRILSMIRIFQRHLYGRRRLTRLKLKEKIQKLSLVKKIEKSIEKNSVMNWKESGKEEFRMNKNV